MPVSGPRTRLLVAALVLSALLGNSLVAGADVSGRHRLKNAMLKSDHLPASGPPSSLVADNFDVLGHSNLGGGSPHGDVTFFDHGGDVGKYAYVGTWSGNCSGVGAKVIDVNDPSNPRKVAFVGGRTGVSNEDLVVQHIGTRDVLAIGVQPCKAQGGTGGLALFNVTKPWRPRLLSFTPFPFGVHELDMVVRDDGIALALLAVPFTEFENQYFDGDLGGEFKIVDVSDPTAPFLLADWGYIADSSIEIVAGNDEVSSSFQGVGDFAAYYAHSARAADGGMSAYVSYWDGGILKFDISDPDEPELIGRTTYPINADGDGHSLTVYDAGGTRYILQNDEDASAYSPPLVTSSATGSTQYAGIEEPWMPQLLTEVGPVSGQVFDAGDGCEASDFAGAAGKIALVDVTDPFYLGIIDGWTHPCTIGSQVLRAIRAGADGMLSSLISPDDAWPFFRSGSKTLTAIHGEAPEDFVVVQVSDIDELADEIRAEAGAVTVTLTPSPPTHGFLRIYDEAGGADTDGDGAVEWTQVGMFDDAPNASGSLAVPPGTWNIHNTEVLDDRAYSSWMSNGIVALDLSDPTAPTMEGQFVPPTNARFAGSLGVGPAEVWGVAIDPETGIVYASDMRTGLWIVEPTGPAAPSG
jgi:hypothetical protein